MKTLWRMSEKRQKNAKNMYEQETCAQYRHRHQSTEVAQHVWLLPASSHYAAIDVCFIFLSVDLTINILQFRQVTYYLYTDSSYKWNCFPSMTKERFDLLVELKHNNQS